MAESRGGTPRGERAAIRARRTPLGAVVGYASVGVPLPCFLLSYNVAQSADREDTGSHRRCSLAKIGAESGEFLPRDDDSGADRIARTVRLALVTRHPEVRAQRASKDAGRGAGGRRPSRLANFVGEHLRMTEELLRNVPEHEDGGALFDIVNRKEHVVGYGCFQYPAGPKILTPSRRSMARPKRYFISAPS